MAVADTDKKSRSSSPLADFSKDAASDVERALKRFIPSGIGALGTGALLEYRHLDVVAGWQFDLEFDDRTRTLRLLLSSDFPFSVPRIALVTLPDKDETWPHLESGGLLCLPETEESNTRDIQELVATAVREAVELIISNASLDFDHVDLRLEFQNYWLQKCTSGAPDFKSILDFKSPSREVAVWWNRDFAILGETAESVAKWVANKNSQPAEEIVKDIEPAILLWLPETLLPDEYPQNAADILDLAKKAEGPAEDLLQSYAQMSPETISVVLASETTEGPVFAAVLLKRPVAQKKWNYKEQFAYKGFRPGKTPPHMATGFFLSKSNKAKRATLDRADSAWVHDRGRNTVEYVSLKNATVGLVGCGSLGSVIGLMLIQSGLGKILLIDPDKLSHTNTSRHALGAEYVGQNKAKALEDYFKKSFPHLGEVESRADHWHEVESKEPELIRGCDLIVSTVGAWRVENALNEVHVTDKSHPPVLYGWLEEMGLAGQAVLILGENGCFHCGFDSAGHPDNKVSSWPEGSPAFKEPGCSVTYQPYGSADGAPVHALITRVAIDFIAKKTTETTHFGWAGDYEMLQANKGEWDKAWCEKFGDPEGGWRRIRGQWRVESNCPACMGAKFR